jgi:hypothetical protein
LTAGGFQFRALLYFAIWLALMFVFDRLSKQQDINQTDRALRRNLKMLAGPGIILYVFAMSFAAIDWVMSLSPHWASTIYGFLFLPTAISSMASVSRSLSFSRAPIFSQVLQKRHLHDLPSFALAVMLWAYFDFPQLLIIWSGNLQKKSVPYRTRLYGGGCRCRTVLVFHFFVPFFCCFRRT